MRNHLSTFLTFSIGFLIVSCGFNNQRQIESLQRVVDSLQNITLQQDSSKAILDSYIETIAVTLDSIKAQENILTLQVDENGRRLKKNEIEANLQTLANVIKRQRERIAELEKNLQVRGVRDSSHYLVIINHLYSQLDEKDMRITELENDLKRQSRTIRQLNTRVSELETDIESIASHAKEQADVIAMQADILNAQNEQLNVGYMCIGSRKDLQNAGILSKNIFSGNKINVSELDMSKFTKIDIRELSEIPCKSKHPKLLSSHPASSYMVANSKDGNSVILIKDPASFWSLTNYLIVLL